MKRYTMGLGYKSDAHEEDYIDWWEDDDGGWADYDEARAAVEEARREERGRIIEWLDTRASEAGSDYDEPHMGWWWAHKFANALAAQTETRNNPEDE